MAFGMRHMHACTHVMTIVSLLSPFMPFLCEELWQRLPVCRGEHDLVDPPSVTVAAYPVSPVFNDQSSESLISLILDVVKVCFTSRRSAIAP